MSNGIENPYITFCPECGWDVKVDEDGCCLVCGATSIGNAVDELAKEMRELQMFRVDLKVNVNRKLSKHPLQNIALDEKGTARYIKNNIVSFLLENGTFDMNFIVSKFYDDKEDLEQFAQLIGYSVYGASDLSYFSDQKFYEAMKKLKELENEKI